MKSVYDLWYRFGTPPWVGDARSELVRLVESGRLRPGRAIDLGCGEGDNAIFLARNGFDVTAVDFAPSAIAKARAKASAAGVEVDFVVDDLTRIDRVRGPYDVLVDYGAFDDLGVRDRARYVAAVVPLTRPGSQFLLWCFEFELRPLGRLATAVLPFGAIALKPGEVHRWFGPYFEIERYAGESGLKTWPRGWAAYLMTRRADGRSASSPE
jgi:SAM-dependent methyltransferase